MQKNTNINIEEELKKCKTVEDLMGKDGLIKRLTKSMLEAMLQEELSHHLGYEKHKATVKKSGNSRNGTSNKKVKSSSGELELDIPRDRNGDFEPQVVKKHQRDVSEFDKKIISMYAKGMTTRDIQDHVFEIYGIQISPALVSIITDKAQILANEWQNRLLSPVYAIVFFDAIYYKVRENGKIISRAAYTCLGIDTEGRKEILGIWIGDSESATFWLSVFNELKNRGVIDILITCFDGLKGLPDAIKAVFPKTEVQLCVVHLIRNSLKYVGSKNKKSFIEDLKKIYQASGETEATAALEALQERWGTLYPSAVNPWINHWGNIASYFKYPAELRRLIYTTNIIEGLHRQFRKVTKNRSIFANGESLFKMLYLASVDIEKKWTHIVRNWTEIINQLNIFFGERINVSL